MEQDDSTGKRDRVWSWLWFAALVIVATVLIGRLQRGDGPERIGYWPKGYSLTPRETILAEPLVKIPWFGGKSLELPAKDRKFETARRWMEATPGASGFIYFERDPKQMAQMTEQRLTWYVRDQEHLSSPAYEVRACAIPYVYGSNPLTATFQSGPVGPFVKVQLPANGKPAPHLDPLEVRAGELKIVFTPRPVLTTLRPLLYDVEISDKGGPISAGLIIGGVAHVIDGKGVIGLYPKPGKPVVCIVTKLAKRSVEVLYRIRVGDKTMSREIFSEGKLIWSRPAVVNYDAKGLPGLKISALNETYHVEHGGIVLGDLNPRDPRLGPLRPGEILRAIDDITPKVFTRTSPGPLFVDKTYRATHYQAEAWSSLSLNFNWPDEGNATLWQWYQ